MPRSRAYLTLSVLAAIVMTNHYAIAGHNETDHPLILRLDTAKESHALYEPVRIRCRAHNRSSRAVETSVFQNPGPPYFEINITDNSQKATKHAKGLLYNMLIVPETLEAGQTKSINVELQWNAVTGDWAFPNPGSYEIRARAFVGSEGTSYLESNSVKINVLPPSGIDLEAIQSFSSKEDFEVLLRDGPSVYCKGKPVGTCFEEIAGFARRFKTSAYSPGIMWRLGEAVAIGTLVVSPKEATAIGLLREFLVLWPDHPSGSSVMSSLVMKLEQHGKHEEAVGVLREYEKKFPDQKESLLRLKRHLGAQ